jgi:hypothetical protein
VTRGRVDNPNPVLLLPEGVLARGSGLPALLDTIGGATEVLAKDLEPHAAEARQRVGPQPLPTGGATRQPTTVVPAGRSGEVYRAAIRASVRAS